MTADLVLNRIAAAAPAHAGRGYDDEEWKERIRALQMEMWHMALEVANLKEPERRRLAVLILHRLLPGDINAEQA